MILTDKFVYIHLPKTGVTFVTSILNQLHCQREVRNGTQLNRLLARISSYCRGDSGNYREVIKHGTCSQIPWAFRSKPIVSNTRNPYDSYVSAYEFGLWIKKYLNPNRDYSFLEFVKLRNGLLEDEELYFDDLSLGFMSKRFIKFFFKQPDNQPSKIDESYLQN